MRPVPADLLPLHKWAPGWIWGSKVSFWRCVGLCAGGSSPVEGHSDVPKLPLLRALPDQAMGVGAYVEVVGANVGLSN